MIAYAALATSVLALIFTVTSFWWLKAREGSLIAARPRTYALLVNSGRVRVRIPLALFNTGPKALLVEDLRIRLENDAVLFPFDWITTRDKLRPEEHDGFAFATPFAVDGRRSKEIIAEFGSDDSRWSPEPRDRHVLRVQVLLHARDGWVDLVASEWWPPLAQDVLRRYIAHRNERPGAQAGAHAEETAHPS